MQWSQCGKSLGEQHSGRFLLSDCTCSGEKGRSADFDCGSADGTDGESGQNILTGPPPIFSVALGKPLTLPPGVCLALMFCTKASQT